MAHFKGYPWQLERASARVPNPTTPGQAHHPGQPTWRAHTGFVSADILPYVELTLAYAHQNFAYAAPLQGAPS